jgi:hypothetical protein
MRVIGLVVSLLFVPMPALASGQTSAKSVVIQASAGKTLGDSGHSVAAAIGFAATPRLGLFLDVERTHIYSQVDGHSVFRGGALTMIAGEVRVAPFPHLRVSPYLLAGMGAGNVRLNVNEFFPIPATHDVRMVFGGGGLQVPISNGLSVFGDVRVMLGGGKEEEFVAMAPVRGGVSWRF